MKKVLITGITGFAGSFLAEHLFPQDIEIHGTYVTDSGIKNVEKIQDKLHLEKIDLTDFESVQGYISRIRPDEIYHLAALPSPAESFKNPGLFLSNNINAQLNILESVRLNHLNSRILIVSSSEMYGLVSEEDLPMDEDTPLRPVSPYGVSKIAQDYLGLQYHLAYKIPVIRVRPFGHVGPRLSEQFAASIFAKKIAEIEKKKREPVLNVGNLSARRDLTDVRDIVRGYQLLMDKAEPGDAFNLGSGRSYVIEDILNTLISFSDEKIEVVPDPALMRPNDIPELRCDNAKVAALTGWQSEIPLEQSLQDTLEYWRERV